MQIRPMRMGDYDEVCALWKRTRGVGVGRSDRKENIRKYLRRNPGLSFVAREDDKPATRRAGKSAGKLVGAVLCGHDGRRGFIGHLAVDRDFRGKGIGKSLVDKCLAGLKRIGIHRCYVFVFTSNLSGQKFWKHTGWRSHSDFTFMSKDLPAKTSKRCSC